MSDVILGMVIGFAAGFLLVFYSVPDNLLRVNAETLITHGCAEYDAKTGKLKFIDSNTEVYKKNDITND